MNIDLFISKQAIDRQTILSDIHMAILGKDTTVSAAVEVMMGKEMIVYKAKGMMKYGLASMKNYMSLHVLPIYGSPVLHSKYKTLLSKASFQKGCINFNNEDEMPLETVQQLIFDCSKINLKEIREEYLQNKKQRARK